MLTAIGNVPYRYDVKVRKADNVVVIKGLYACEEASLDDSQEANPVVLDNISDARDVVFPRDKVLP